MDVHTEDQINILHVEDEPDIAELTKSFLEQESESFEVRTETEPETAVQIVNDEQFDCIVSDYNMPGMNGIDLLQEIRSDHPDLPFILYTGRGSEEIASEAISAGVTDYLQKGSGTDHYVVLANRIENAVDKYRTQREIQETTEFYRTVLEHSSDYVMIVDDMGKVSYISPAIERVLGYTPEEVKQMDAFEFVHPDDISKATASLQQNIENPGVESTVEFRAQHADGSWRWLEVRGRNLIDDPVIGGIMVNVRDITTRKQGEKELEQQKERLQQFASFLSHDVRNQLSVVDGNLELAKSHDNIEELETARNRLDRIDTMIEKLMNLAQTDNLESESVEVDLSSIVKKCRNNIGASEIELVVDSDISFEVYESRIESLFENIILNAIDHGDADTIYVGSLGDASGFYIADDGSGISADNGDKIFETGYTTSEEGSGLGLAIVEEIATTHDWSVDVCESAAGGLRLEFSGVSTP